MVTTPFCANIGLSANLCGMLYNTIFPWVLTFAVIFGLLMKSKVFGETGKDARGVSGIIALVMGFLVTAFVPGYGQTIGSFFINTSGTLMMFLMVILGLLLVIGLVNKDYLSNYLTGTKGLIYLVAIVLIAWMLLGGWLGGGVSFYALFKQDLFALIIILAVIAAMWYFVMGGDTGTPGEKPE
ncbi:MAG: hypothetical protein ACP5E4_00980 [Candidatus Aenigmatarchaeota archaeon]